MHRLSSLFQKKSAAAPLRQLLALQTFMNDKLAANEYVAKSQFRPTLLAEKETVGYFAALDADDMLPSFCHKHGIKEEAVRRILANYRDFEEWIDRHNEDYIRQTMVAEKAYLDSLLAEVDPRILLDEDQRRAVLTDEDHCLVIAGAGAGKTTTVAAKVKYLVEKKNVPPSQLLVISFTNKAVEELKDRINRELRIQCPIHTFHAAGNDILQKQSSEKFTIVDNSKLYTVIQDHFRASILQNEGLVNNLILFFASYFDAPYEGNELGEFFQKAAKGDYTTLRSELEEFQKQLMDIRTQKTVTIQSEVMRSRQEVEIANFLYLHSIPYEYEPLYQHNIPGSRKPYTPDFLIRQGDKIAYIEHFGISEDGQNDRFSEEQLANYKKAIQDKIRHHKQHGTTLLCTYARYNDSRPLLDHLQDTLQKHGFALTPRSRQEVLEKLIAAEENRYIRKLVSLICRFITNFKANGYSETDFNTMSDKALSVRTKLFLSICRECYLVYQGCLQENHAIDFEDMINRSAHALQNAKERQLKLNYRYIIVDEYQDISRQRFDLVTALAEVTDAKIIAVGDDWQSIYAFSGADITLFTKFEEKMGYAKLLKIVRTYRSAQEVIDIAGGFIQKNTAQIPKALRSAKTIADPVLICTYDGSQKKRTGEPQSGPDYAMGLAVEAALAQILAYGNGDGKPAEGTILLLGRFKFDRDRLERSGLFTCLESGQVRSVTYPHLSLTFMTIHASKGLGFDNVIVLNGRNETYGFPAKIEDDPVLALVIRGDRSIDHAEERRLFYVAMTRTKNRVYFVAPQQNPSEFLLELQRDYKNVVLYGHWNGDVPEEQAKKTCPLCGYPLQYRYKNGLGLRLYICTNEPEVCGFLTNEYAAGKLSILKCEQCRDGYLIVKPGTDNSYFLGCTNYKKDHTGCGNTIAPKAYYEMFHLEPVPTALPAPEKLPLNRTTVVEIVSIILRCLAHISERKCYGLTMLLDVLQGVPSKRILETMLNDLPEYSSLAALEREALFGIVVWLIENGFICQTKGQYPVLQPAAARPPVDEAMTDALLEKCRKRLP